MSEFFVAALVVVALAALGAAALVPWWMLLRAGAWIVALGFAAGVPAGIVYHARLYAALRRLGDVPRGWIWRPIELHTLLSPGERRRVLPWAYAGGAGFAVIVLGIVCVGLAMLSGFADVS